MIRIQLEDFKSLFNNNLYDGLYQKLLAIAKGEPGGVVAFDETSLPEAFARLLEQWLRTGVEFTKSYEPTDALAKLQQQQREAAEAQERAINIAANERVEWHVREQGMKETQKNSELLLRWFQTNKADYTSYNIDLAVEALASQLEWSVWSPRRQPVEQARTLPNGQPELPLNATEAQMRAASVEQLKDLSKRRNEGKAHRSGSFGSKFFEETVKRDRPLI